MSLLPPGWTIATVFGQYVRLDGTPNVGSIEFTSEQVLRVDDGTGTGAKVLVVPKRQVATLDAEGRFSIELPVADWDNLEYPGWAYHVSEQVSGGREIDIVLHAADSPLDLVDADIVVPPPEVEGTRGPQGFKGDKGDKGDPGDVTPEAAELLVEAQAAATNAADSAALAQNPRQMAVGPRPMGDFGWYAAFPNSTYLTIDKPGEQDDGSIVYTVDGAARWEVGACTELPGHVNDYHVKRVTGAAGAEVFTDVLMVDWATGNTWLPSPFMLGVGGKPAYPLHVVGNEPAGRVAMAIQNANMGAGSGSTELVFATGPGGTWSIGNDYGENGGDNLFIASSTGGLLVLVDDATFAITGNVTAAAATLSGLATLNAGLLLGAGGAFQQGAIYADAGLGVVHGAKSGVTYDWSLTDTAGLSVLTLDHNTRKLTAWDTLTANNGVVVTGVGAFQQGAIYKDGAFGLTQAGIAGVTNELTWFNAPGVLVLRLPAGSATLDFANMPTVATVPLKTALSVLSKTGDTGTGDYSLLGNTTFGAVAGGSTTTFNRPGTSSAGSSIQFSSPSGVPGITGFNGAASRTDIRFSANILQFGVSAGVGTPTIQLEITAALVQPGSDNGYPLGASGRRWSVVYAATGTINTSDAREKSAVSPLTANELAAAAELARGVGTYQWLEAIQLKGADARHHAGLTVQQAIAIMQAHGLDPMTYGFICYDQWPETPEVVNSWPARDAVLDDEGNVIEPAVEAGSEVTQAYSPAGDRYSFRPDELALWLSRGLIQLIDDQKAAADALTARVAALEAAP